MPSKNQDRGRPFLIPPNPVIRRPDLQSPMSNHYVSNEPLDPYRYAGINYGELSMVCAELGEDTFQCQMPMLFALYKELRLLRKIRKTAELLGA